MVLIHTLNCSQCAHVENLRFKYLWLTQTQIVGRADGKKTKKKWSGRDVKGRNACLAACSESLSEKILRDNSRRGEEHLSLQTLARLHRSNDITYEGKWDGTGTVVCLFYLSTQYFTLHLPFVKTTLCLFKASVNFRKFLQRTVTTLSIACCQVPAPCPKALRSFHQIHQGEQLLGTSHHLNNRACIIRKDYIMPNITVVRVDFGIPQIVCIHAVFLLLNSSLCAYPTLCWKYSVIDTRCETHDAWQVASLSPGKMETSSGIPTSVARFM